MPNPFSPPVATASVTTKVVIENLTSTTITKTVHIIILPERPMCLYDLGVRGPASINYSLYDTRFATPIWQKNFSFDGSEMLGGPVVRDGGTWFPMPGPITLGEFGSFGGAMVLQDSFFDVFFDVQLQPLQTLSLDLKCVGKSQLGQNSVGPQGQRFAAITNTLPSCYANCDGSTTPPVLNVQDFSCYLNRYAAGDPWANCDGSTTPPVLNVQDFACFLNRYAQGCEL